MEASYDDENKEKAQMNGQGTDSVMSRLFFFFLMTS